ncbi:MAG TPA: hypothetical protein DCR65_04375, partial [Gammaproteobacteria bacterium]|nr:hypothetical protein [Gammaproteobacteria bacterium]
MLKRSLGVVGLCVLLAACGQGADQSGAETAAPAPAAPAAEVAPAAEAAPAVEAAPAEAASAEA